MTKVYAVTGGTGFLGAAIIERLLSRGDAVKALARGEGRLKSSSDRLHPIVGSLGDEHAVKALVDGADAVIHCAGLTHARRDCEFHEVNAAGAGRVAAAASKAGAFMVHVSSIAARRPEVSTYAASKRGGEDAVRAASARWAALRAPAIYGPGDAATLPYFRLVKSGFAPEPAATPAPRASILYVDDVADAAIATADAAPANGVYDLGDDRPEGRSWAEIGAALAAALRVQVRAIRAPRTVLLVLAGAVSSVGRAFGAAPMLTPGKIAEFFHPDWVARDNLLQSSSKWRPLIALEDGFAKAARWYKENGDL